ncbi:DUF5642 family protein [Mycobacterium lepromatosis]|uniref:DUF5642 family protein n=1 Tax=Mycobacterium lepromatosis TaxID=480418 RepID=UPI000AE0D0BF|nr:DUF5642 family protein [Mycobacterium lepromatosis]
MDHDGWTHRRQRPFHWATRIDGVDTLGMAVDVWTSVESGTEIDLRTYTYTPYRDNYYAFATLTTDLGSAFSALAP